MHRLKQVNSNLQIVKHIKTSLKHEAREKLVESNNSKQNEKNKTGKVSLRWFACSPAMLIQTNTSCENKKR